MCSEPPGRILPRLARARKANVKNFNEKIFELMSLKACVNFPFRPTDVAARSPFAPESRD